MLKNIFTSLIFAVVIPTFANLISNKVSDKGFKLDIAYFLKIGVLFFVSVGMLTLLDYML